MAGDAEGAEALARADRHLTGHQHVQRVGGVPLPEQDLAGDGYQGAKCVCSPPPRDKQNQQAVWDGLARDRIEGRAA